MCSNNGASKATHAPAPRWSMSRRLILFYVATTAALLVLATSYLYWTQLQNLDREDSDFLVAKLRDCGRVLEEQPTDAALLANEIQVEPTASLMRYYVGLLDDKGQVLVETPGMSNLLARAAFPAAAALTDMSFQSSVWKPGKGQTLLLMSAQAPVTPGQTSPRVLHAALDVSAEAALISGYRSKLVVVVVLGCVFSWVAGALLTRKGLQPLAAMTEATERVSANRLQARIVSRGWPIELAALAKSFDRMLERLDDSFTRLSQFSADLAHELRTPINNLRGEAGVALSKPRTAEEYRQTLESSLEEYARLARLIDNMLFLARAEGNGANQLARSCFDAGKEVQGVCDFYEALAAEKGVKLECEGAGMVHADSVLFRQAVSNVLSNALNHTEREGSVKVELCQTKDKGLAVRISDTGCGIEPEHLPRIFDRLYRVDSSRSRHPNGAGLGLAIVKSILVLHQGSVEAQSTVGQGTTITLLFPAEPVSVVGLTAGIQPADFLPNAPQSV